MSCISTVKFFKKSRGKSVRSVRTTVSSYVLLVVIESDKHLFPI